MRDQNTIAKVIKQRLGDYKAEDFVEQRRKLVEAWRNAYPEAAKETSSYLKPLMLVHVAKHNPVDAQGRKLPDEEWANDTYYVTLRRYPKDPVFRSDGGVIQLGISSLDGTARHDWRDFQAVKNQLAGPECEAFELYPAESRLLDPSNYYTLWCFPGVKRLKVGNETHEVLDGDVALAPQRSFPVALDENKKGV
jgi:hypothetical protein